MLGLAVQKSQSTQATPTWLLLGAMPRAPPARARLKALVAAGHARAGDVNGCRPVRPSDSVLIVITDVLVSGPVR